MNPDQLKNIEVLQGIDPEALRGLAAALEEKNCADGQTIFAEGDPGDSMYFLIEGRVRIAKRSQAAGARQKTLAVLEAGDYFGEMALLDQKPRSASAIAAGNAKIFRLSKTAFDELSRSGGDAALAMLFAMIRTSSERIRRLSAQLVVYDEVGKAIGEAQDLQSLLDRILEQLLSGTAADWGLLLLRSQFSNRLELRSALNVSLTPAQHEALNNSQGFLGPLLQAPNSHLVPDFEEHELSRTLPRLGFETSSLLISPIMLGDSLLGLIILGGLERAQFDLNMLNLTKGVARQAAQAILNARHRDEEQARSRHGRQFVRF